MQTWSKSRVAIRPWQAIPDVMAQWGLTDEDGMTQAWFIAADGRLFGGAEAINRAMRLVWWARPFTWLYVIPGLRQLENWAYRWVAANRYRLPGSTPSCEMPPPPEKDQ